METIKVKKEVLACKIFADIADITIEDNGKRIPNMESLYVYIQCSVFDNHGLFIIAEDSEQTNFHKSQQYYFVKENDNMVTVYSRKAESTVLFPICKLAYLSSLSNECISTALILSCEGICLPVDAEIPLTDIMKLNVIKNEFDEEVIKFLEYINEILDKDLNRRFYK